MSQSNGFFRGGRGPFFVGDSLTVKHLSAPLQAATLDAPEGKSLTTAHLAKPLNPNGPGTAPSAPASPGPTSPKK